MRHASHSFPRLPLHLYLLALLAIAALPLRGASFYVNQVRGSDTNGGSQNQPFKTVARALHEVDGVGGEINLSPEGGPYRESIFIRKGGQPGYPLILDGHGAVINLGIDVTKGPWIDTGPGFLLNRPVARNSRLWMATVAFVNGLPLFCDGPPAQNRPLAWHGGSVRYDDQGRLILVFPRGLNPSNSVVVLTGGADGDFACCVHAASASYIQIRNLTAAFASNDGFNFHGSGHDILEENVKGLFNGDQGTSSHETSYVEARDSEFAFNGSGDGAVEDIQDSVTTYRNIRVHQNRDHGFFFPKPGKQAHHLLDHVVSFGNGVDNLPPPSAAVQLENCQDLGQIGGDQQIPVVANPDAPVDPNQKVDENDRLGRFLQVRPPADDAPGIEASHFINSKNP